MNFVPFLALFVFAPIDLPSDLPGERDWSKLVLFLFREWFRLHFDSSSTAAANHSVSKPNHKATPRLKHRLTGPFLIGFKFRNATSIRRCRKKHLSDCCRFVWYGCMFDVLLIPHSRNPKGKWVNVFGATNSGIVWVDKRYSSDWSIVFKETINQPNL